MRAAFSFSRDLEFASRPELEKRMGIIREGWLRATLKELIDNALDATEEAGIGPVIDVVVTGNEINVTDSGPGMPAELIERLCNRAKRTSAREAYAAPDRGAQGNALQTIMALGFGFGRDVSRITIDSRGVNHQVALNVNRLAGQVDLQHLATPATTGAGTRVTLPWPVPPDRAHIHRLIWEHAWLNPHSEITLTIDGEEVFGAEATTAVRKWTPGLPIPAAWYTPERFAHRILLEIKRDPAITVAQFLATFAGLKGTVKRSEVAAASGLSYRPLAALLDGNRVDAERAERLLVEMQAAARAPRPDVLGGIGRETFELWAGNLDYGDPQLLTYNTFDTVVYGSVPIRWEIGFCYLPGAQGRQLLVGQNFSPALLPNRMADIVLQDAAWQFSASEQIALLLHRITPARQTVDFGKTIPVIYQVETRFVAQALAKLAAPWIKYRERQIRGKTPVLPSAPKPERVTIKDAVNEALPEAYDQASSSGKYPTSPRQLYYRLRPKVLALTGKDELGYGYFAADLLPHYLQDHADAVADWRIHFKPRGELREPHTGRVIPLGTAEVAFYRQRWTNGEAAAVAFDMPEWSPDTVGPRNRYGGLLIIEKEGIADLLIMAGVGERFDVAIVGNEGQSVEAELRLADALGIPVFVLHDFDRTGMTISQNLREGTWRHRYQNAVEVIEIGLRLDQVAGLESEPISKSNYESVGDERLRECGATKEEIAFLGPHGDAKAAQGRRVELNALTTEDLVKLVEAALAEHGIGKIVPEADDLAAAWRAAKAHAEIATAVEAANEHAQRWLEVPAPADLTDQIREQLADDSSLSWDEALRRIVEEAP